MNPRLAATYVLYDIIVGRQSLSATLNERLAAIDNAADRGLCQEIVYGTLRHYPSLQATLAPFLRKAISNKNKPLEILLCSAIYQLYQLKLPDYAVINESVAVVKTIDFAWARGFINAVLRHIARAKERTLTIDKDVDHPKWLAKKIRTAYPTRAKTVFAANHHPARVMLRVRHGSRDDYLKQLQQDNIKAIPHLDNKDAVVLMQSTAISDLPEFRQGGVTVQDANAQLAANLLGIKANMRILDACAAPGGKTAHIADKADNLQITAVDHMPGRIAMLNNTLERLNVRANVVTADLQNIDAWYDGQAFDRILLDAPCSATGVIRKHPDILFHRQESDLQNLTDVQTQLLHTCWPLLAPGGRLLYATCSILPEENIDQVKAFLAQTPDAGLKPLGHNRAIQNNLGTLQFLPDEWGDGFFYAALEKG